jgi:hypothetical protein
MAAMQTVTLFSNPLVALEDRAGSCENQGIEMAVSRSFLLPF